MNPKSIMSHFFFIKNPHCSSLNSVTFKECSNLHANVRLKWELSLTRDTERGNTISAGLHRKDRKWHETVAAVEKVTVAETETKSGSDLKLQEESNHDQLTQSITVPNVIAKTLITGTNIQYATYATLFLVDYLLRSTMKFLRNSPEVEVILGPLKDSMSAVDKVAPKWVSGVVSIVLISATVFGRLKEKEPNNVSFKDIIGIDAVISQFQSILSILPKIGGCKIIGIEVPDGFLVYGPQRTGKTTLVHALARQSKLPFFPVYARDIAKIGIQGLKRLFVEARRSSPSIIFIENIERIAAKEETGETDPILEELRKEMDNCRKFGKEVVVIATTDKREKLDPFMTKAGWFNSQVHVPTPDADGRRKIVNYLLKDFLREEDKEACDMIVFKTKGLVWGNIKHICGLVSSFAKERGDTHVTVGDVQRAFEKLEGINDEYAQLG